MIFEFSEEYLSDGKFGRHINELRACAKAAGEKVTISIEYPRAGVVRLEEIVGPNTHAEINKRCVFDKDTNIFFNAVPVNSGWARIEIPFKGYDDKAVGEMFALGMYISQASSEEGCEHPIVHISASTHGNGDLSIHLEVEGVANVRLLERIVNRRGGTMIFEQSEGLPSSAFQ